MRWLLVTWACMIFTCGGHMQVQAGENQDAELVEVTLRVWSVRTEYLDKLNLNPNTQSPQFDELALPEDKVPEDGIEIVAEAATSKRPPVSVLKLDWQSFKMVGRKIQADPKTNVDASPQLTLCDGCDSAATKVGIVTRPFVVGVDESAKPIIQQIDEGLIVKIIGRKLDNGDWLLRSSLRFQSVEDVETRSVGNGVKVQVPSIKTFTMKTSAKLKPDDTLLIWGPEETPSVPAAGWFGKKFKAESYTKLITLTLKTVESLGPDDVEALSQAAQ